jgi:small subunit ribosomal protein S3Ae
MFCIGFTKKRQNTQRKTCYAQTAQIRRIRAKMMSIMIREATNCELNQLVAKLVPEAIGKEIEKSCQSIYPLQNVFIRKVKVLKTPKFDLNKLMEVHGEGGKIEETGVAVDAAVADA